MKTWFDEGVKKLGVLKGEGFVGSLRRGPTGIVHTLESKLDLEGNKLSAPFFGDLELKAVRAGGASNRLITLFTYDREVWRVDKSTLIRDYGVRDNNYPERINLHTTVQSNSRGVFRLTVGKKQVCLVTPEGNIVATWVYEELLRRIREKVRHFILVQAQSNIDIGGVEQYWYNKATLHTGCLFSWHLSDLFKEGVLLIDLRMHLKNKRVRNHGTGFRIKESELTRLFPNEVELPLDYFLSGSLS